MDNTSRASQRIGVLMQHLAAGGAPENLKYAQCAARASGGDRFSLGSSLRWNGWGYADTEFILNNAGQIQISGSRYQSSGQVLPNFRAWAETNIGLKIDETSPAQEKMAVPPVVNRNEAFLAAIASQVSRLSFDDEQRAFHAHGHSCQEVYTLRFGSFTRVPDVVVWPGSHAHVEAIVRAAIEHNVVIIPYGGGTTVTHALLPPDQERRMVVSLDMHDMNKLKWVNKTNMLACFEAGIIGKEIEETLNAQGLCFGHEPDSHEFSSLGGWVATRASGMKKNVYGNIEDMIVGIKFVTPQGVLEKNGLFARISNGPDLHEVVLGSEGTLGVVTEVTIKVRPLPAVRKYGSVIFPDFTSGYRAMQEVGLSRAQPASIRLMDNPQFQFGQALKPAPHSSVAATLDKVKKLYVTKLLGFDVNAMTAVTLMFEGSAESVRAQEKKVYSIMAKHGGRPAGEENGIRGYFLTFMIAYLRDFGFKYNFMAESFETTVPYDKVLPLCEAVKAQIRDSCKARGIAQPPFVSCRVTQLYDNGACVYFYFGLIFKGLKDPTAVFSAVEHEARERVLACGGSLSHHHGIGKLRKSFLPDAVGPTGMKLLTGLKQQIDPKNVFGAGNLL